MRIETERDGKPVDHHPNQPPLILADLGAHRFDKRADGFGLLIRICRIAINFQPRAQHRNKATFAHQFQRRNRLVRFGTNHRRHRADETKSAPVVGFDDSFLPYLGLQRLARQTHGCLQGGFGDMRGPERIQQLRFGHHSVVVFDKIRKNSKSLGRDGKCLFVLAQFKPVGV